MPRTNSPSTGRSRLRVREVWKRGWGRDYRVRDAWFETLLGDNDEWIAAFNLVIQHGRPVVAELRVYPNEEQDPDVVNEAGRWSGSENAEDVLVPEGGLTSTTSNKVRFLPLESIDEIVARAREHPSRRRDLEEFGFRSTTPARRRPGPKGKSDLYLARLALAYVNRIAAGERNPVKGLAKQRNRSEGQMRDLIHLSRDRGLLSEAPVGRAGGHLTPYAEELLENHGTRDRR